MERKSILTAPQKPAPPPPPRGSRLVPSPSDYRPLRGGERRENKDGTYSTEITITVPSTSGKWINIPSLWMGPKGPVELTEDEAVRAAKEHEKRTGKKFPEFGTVKEAVSEAIKRSKAGGATSVPLEK